MRQAPTYRDHTMPEHFEHEALVPQRVLLTGGTGLIGQPLVQQLLDADCEVSVLTRYIDAARRNQPGPVHWLDDLAQWPVEWGVDVIINLAGESLAEGRWTAARKERMWDSRIETTRSLVKLAGRLPHPPACLINASAVGYYGPQGDQPLVEDSTPNDSFSHRLCSAWETEADRMRKLGVDVVKLRFGVVLSRQGGALQELLKSFSLKVGTTMGNGQQWLSWIHLHDLLGIVLYSLQHHQTLRGEVNATAPEPVTYRDLARKIADRTRPLVMLPLPRPLLRIMLGEMADELLLSGQRVLPKRLLQQGYSFRYPTLGEALEQLL